MRDPDNQSSTARQTARASDRGLGPLGILGGGQLARMTIEAASTLGLDVVVAERAPHSPAARVATEEIVFAGTWDDDAALRRLALLSPTITLENEFVDAEILRRLEALGSCVLPGPDCLEVVQDKLMQKERLRGAGLPVPLFRGVSSPSDVVAAARELAWPLMLKARRNGYDGYGNVLVRGPEEVESACVGLGWPDRTLMVEAFVPFERELAIVVARGIGGQMVAYPLVESRQHPERHICQVILAPASVPTAVTERASAIARGAVEAVGGVGIVGVEMFLLPDGEVLINEMAPRPHNSGHYTIEACVTSQFANHVRAVFDLPLGPADLRAPAAAMVNLLGSGAPTPDREALAAVLAIPGAYVHMYGKAESRIGRKMGHVTALGDSLDDALARAQAAADRLPV